MQPLLASLWPNACATSGRALLLFLTAVVFQVAFLGPADASAQDRQEGYVRSEQPSGEMRYVYFEAIEDSLVRIREGREKGGPSVSVSAFGFRSICSSLKAVTKPATGVDTVSSTNISFKDGTFRFSFARDLGPLLPIWTGLTVLLVGGMFWQGWRLRKSRRAGKRQAEARRQLEAGRERERRHLAREIHDGPLQDLLGLRMHLVASNGGAGAKNAEAEEEPVPLQAELRRAARALRAMSEDLRPPELETDGLNAALRAQAERLQERFPDLEVTFEEVDSRASGANGRLPEGKQRALFRIGQEAMSNAAQHGQARHVSVRLRHNENGALLEVTDDGRGFKVPGDGDFSGFAQEGHYGLLGMAERAELHEIDLSVTSEPGAGTHVRARLAA